jgi:hypothetical protein
MVVEKSSFERKIRIVHKMDSVYTINAFQVSTGVGTNITKVFYFSTRAENES